MRGAPFFRVSGWFEERILGVDAACGRCGRGTSGDADAANGRCSRAGAPAQRVRRTDAGFVPVRAPSQLFAQPLKPPYGYLSRLADARAAKTHLFASEKESVLNRATFKCPKRTQLKPIIIRF